MKQSKRKRQLGALRRLTRDHIAAIRRAGADHLSAKQEAACKKDVNRIENEIMNLRHELGSAATDAIEEEEEEERARMN